MTHLPPPNEPGASHPEDAEGRHAERPATDDSSSRMAPGSRLRLSAPVRPAVQPFVWQHGSRLYLLDREGRGWVLAELAFLSDACHYVEVRRTSYRWPREAAGVLLSRSLAVNQATARRLATDLTAWMANEQTPVKIRRRKLTS